jgi:hypothetical protein
MGDREHSTAARYILQSFPFKVFSISTLYSELPQKLCLTFQAPQIKRETENVISIGFEPEDAAKEFSAEVAPVGWTVSRIP